MRYSLPALLLLCSTLTGCAFSVHDVKVNYQYNASVSQDLSTAKKAPVKIGEFKDERGMQNPRMIFNMQNLNGQTTTGGWQAEKPVAEIVRDGISQGLEKAKLPLSDTSGQLELRGELLEFDYKAIMGAWQGTIQPRLMVKLQIVDSANRAIIWKDTLISKASITGNTEIQNYLKASIDQLVTDLLEDEYFLQKIKEGA